MMMRGVRLTVFLIALLGLESCRSTGPGGATILRSEVIATARTYTELV